MPKPGDIKVREESKFIYSGYGVWEEVVDKTKITDPDGDIADIKPNELTGNNELLVNLEDYPSAENSSTTPLGPGDVFPGEWTSTQDYGTLAVVVSVDVDSAEDGLDIQWSKDGLSAHDHDHFTIYAGESKTFTFGATWDYFKIQYTNGVSQQTTFILGSGLKRGYVKPSSHRMNDDIVGQDDAELVTAILKVQTNNANIYKNVNVQNPLPTDGDSIYGKDLDLTRSELSDGWTGSVTDLFNDSYTTIVNDSSNNPKTITLTFKRPFQTNIFGMTTSSGDFSNTEVETGLVGSPFVPLVDESADNTKKTLLVPPIPPTTLSRMIISFHTADTVTVSSIAFSKALQRISRIQALKPDGTVTDIDATAGGNLKVSLEEFDSSFNDTPLPVSEQSKTAFGDLKTAELHPQFQGSFEYTVSNTDLMINAATNGGTVTQALGMGVIGTSTTTNSSAMLESKQHARYKSGLGGLARFTALFTSPVAATEQYVGLSDEHGSSAAFKNGYIVGYDGTTFGFHRFQNDTKITIAQAAWDDPMDGTGASGMTLDQTKLNIYAIQYQYLGAGAIKLFIESDTTGMFVLVHTIHYANLNTEPSTHNPNFHFHIHVHNKGTTDNLIIKSSSYAYFVEGKTSFIELHQPENASGTQTKTTVTTETAIFTIRNKSTYASKTNYIDILLIGFGASIEANSANNLGSVRVIKNTTLGGTPSYSDINTNNSVIEIDTAGTTITGGKDLGGGLLAGKNDGFRISLIDDKIILNPGDTLTFAGTSANSATIDSQSTWRELF